MLLHAFDVHRIVFDSIQLRLKDFGGFELAVISVKGRNLAAMRAALSLVIHWHCADVFLPAFVVKITQTARPSHLQKLARHIHPDEVLLRFILLVQFVDFFGGEARDVRRAKAPVRKKFAFVWLHEQHALLADSDAVKLGLFAKICFFEIEAVIEFRHIR